MAISVMVEVVLGSFGRHFERILEFWGPRTSDPEAWNGQGESKMIFHRFWGPFWGACWQLGGHILGKVVHQGLLRWPAGCKRLPVTVFLKRCSRPAESSVLTAPGTSPRFFIDFGVHFGVHVGSLEATFSEKSSTRVSEDGPLGAKGCR